MSSTARFSEPLRNPTTQQAVVSTSATAGASTHQRGSRAEALSVPKAPSTSPTASEAPESRPNNAAAERIAQVWPAFRTFVEGRPTVVVRDGALIEGSLDRLGVNASELKTALRRQGADGIDEGDLATFDPGGSITVDVKRAEQALSYGEFTAAMARLEARLDSLTPPAVH